MDKIIVKLANFTNEAAANRYIETNQGSHDQPLRIFEHPVDGYVVGYEKAIGKQESMHYIPVVKNVFRG